MALSKELSSMPPGDVDEKVRGKPIVPRYKLRGRDQDILQNNDDQPVVVVLKDGCAIGTIHASNCKNASSKTMAAAAAVVPDEQRRIMNGKHAGEMCSIKKEAVEVQQRTNGIHAVEMCPVKKEVVELLSL